MLKHPGHDELELLLDIVQIEAALDAVDSISLAPFAEDRLPAVWKNKRLHIEAEIDCETASNGLSSLYVRALRVLADRITQDAPTNGREIAIAPGASLLEMVANNNWLLGAVLDRMGLALNKHPERVLKFLYGAEPITRKMSDTVEPSGFLYNLDQIYRKDLEAATGLPDAWGATHA